MLLRSSSFDQAEELIGFKVQSARIAQSRLPLSWSRALGVLEDSMRRFHLSLWPRALHWPGLDRQGLHLPESVVHPSGRLVDEAAVVAAIVVVCVLLVLAF